MTLLSGKVNLGCRRRTGAERKDGKMFKFEGFSVEAVDGEPRVFVTTFADGSYTRGDWVPLEARATVRSLWRAQRDSRTCG